jgi:hypothetical protein
MESTMGRPPIGKVAMTGAERVRRFRAKQRAEQPVTERNETPVTKQGAADGAEIERLKAENERLRKELTAAREDVAAQAMQFRDELKRRAAKPKAEKAPLPPDEVRERQIKSLQTRVRNLTAELHAAREWHRKKADGTMSFATMSAISKALHPDRELSEEERSTAFKLFNAWKSDKGRRR